MNYFQFGLFFTFVFSLLCSGIGIYRMINPGNDCYLNRSIFLGETLLIGGAVVVGELLLLSIFGLYTAPYLWAAVGLNALFLLKKTTRAGIKDLFQKKPIQLSSILFVFLMVLFFFRNCYFLVDVDSHEAYLFIQKIWLMHGTSIFADRGIDSRIFVSHFDAVPYGLGISVFGQETLFPQLINWFWRSIVLLLVFGYTSYRFNGYYGIAATMFVLFNDHFFFSGANQAVVLNGALIALIFAISYNIWEGRKQNDSFRLLLAGIFISQLIANKYQMVYITVFLFILAVTIQKEPFRKINEIISNKKQTAVLLIACLFTSLWFIKNYLATGLASFPIFAGNFHILGWTPEFSHVFMSVFRGLTLGETLKYISYLYIWPGINPAKYVGLGVTFLPLILMVSFVRDKFNKDDAEELCYWLFLSVLILVGICIASHQDPRYYRFNIGILSFAAVYLVHFIFTYCFSIKSRLIVGAVLLILSFSGYHIIFSSGGAFKRPSMNDNMNVLLNKTHMKDIIPKHFPSYAVTMEGYNANKERAEQSAWNVDSREGSFSAFLVPVRPQAGLWRTALISWPSYDREEDIVKDLKDYGVKWIMDVEEGIFIFRSLEEYASKAVNYRRYPKTIRYPYTMPPELTRTKF